MPAVDVEEVTEYLVGQRSDGSVVELVHGADLGAQPGELDRARWSLDGFEPQFT